MRIHSALLAALLTLAFASTAQAVHWPNFGGEAGRSGYQPVDEGGVPVTFSYSKTNAEDLDIRTSVITSAGGGPATQRTIYGTSDGSAGSGSVHTQVLGTGAAVGAEAGVDVNQGAGTNAFGSGDGSVSPVDTSSATALGQTFQVHNDGNAIEIAKIDQETGALSQADIAVTGSTNFVINSSPVVTGTDTTRTILFIAANGADERLFKVELTNATSTTASVATTTLSAADTNATPLSSPTIANLTPPGPGAVTPYVLFGTTSVATAPTVQACRLSNITTCDLSSAGIGNVTESIKTPSLPVTDSGQPPASAPHVFVSRSNSVLGTSVDRLVQATPGAVLTRPAGAANTVSLGSLAASGTAAPALALDQEVVGGAVEPGGRVIVTTTTDLFSADADDLGGGTTTNNGTQAVAAMGFGRTTALISGESGYVTRNNGTQVVFNAASASDVSAANFTQNAGNTPASGFGQPSLSRGFVQFASNDGLFVYRNADLIDPTITLDEPAEGTVVRGDLTLSAKAFDARGIQAVAFRVNGVTLGNPLTTGTGSQFAAPGATFGLVGSTIGAPNGTYVIDAVALDGGGRFKASNQRTIRIDNPVPGTNNPPITTDKTKPSCTNRVAKSRLRTALRRGLRVRVRCNEAGRGDVQILRQGSKKRVSFTRASTKTVKVTFNARARRALARKRSVTIRVRTTVTDAAGNKGAKTTRVTLKR